MVYVGLCRPWVCMYVCQHFQTSSPLKPLGRLKPNSIWSLLGMVERNFCSNSPGHMTKVAAMPIYDKNLKISSPEPKDR